MRPWKTVFGLLGVLLPIAYCGGLVYYFSSVGGTVEGSAAIGLGPTILGLGVIGLLFCVPLVYRLLKIATAAGSSGAPARGDTPAAEPESDFDPDAALARYMAKRAAGEVQPPPLSALGETAAPRGFGRRGL